MKALRMLDGKNCQKMQKKDFPCILIQSSASRIYVHFKQEEDLNEKISSKGPKKF